jgi:hypothetical protein
MADTAALMEIDKRIAMIQDNSASSSSRLRPFPVQQTKPVPLIASLIRRRNWPRS